MSGGRATVTHSQMELTGSVAATVVTASGGTTTL